MKRHTIFILAAVALWVISVSCIRTKNNANTIINVKDSIRIKPYRTLASFKGDTLEYLRYTFIERKDRYIGKPLNNILNDSEIEVKLWYGRDVPSDRFIISGLDLKFDDPQTHTNRINKNSREGVPISSLEKIYGIGVVWQEPASMEMNNALIRQSGGNWNQTVRDSYGPMIIKSIIVYQAGGPVYKSDQ